MEPYVPTAKTIKSADQKVEFTIRLEGGKASLKELMTGNTIDWKQSMAFPSKGLLSHSLRYIILLGDFGNPASGLGKVAIYNFEGKLVREFKLQESISDLAALAAKFSKRGGSSQWIAAAALDKSENLVTIDVCKQKQAVLDLAKLTVSVKP